MTNLRSVKHGKVSRWFITGDVFELNEYMNEVVPHGQMPIFTLNILAGITPAIDPFLEVTGDDPFDEFIWETFPAASPSMLAIATVLTEEPRPQIAIDWDQLEATPEAVRFQLSSKTWDCFTETVAFEIGRFITRENETGLIKSIQTEIAFEPNDFRWPRGDSRYYQRELDATPGSEVGLCRIKWALKIESLGSTDPDPTAFRVESLVSGATWISELPGMVHPELAPWEGMRFLWGHDHYVRLRCPANSLVSLWVYAYNQATTSGLWVASGMLKGQTQIQESERTYCNMTRMD